MPINGEDPEFDQLFGYYQGQTQLPLLSPIVSLVESGIAPIVSTMSSEVTEVAPSTTGVLGVPAVQLQLSENAKAHVGPGSDIRVATAKQTTAQTTALATVRQDVAETLDAGNIRDLHDLEEPLVIHAPSEIGDSTPPVTKPTACPGGQEMSRASQSQGLSKSPASDRRTTVGHQHSPGKRRHGFSAANSYSVQKRSCMPQQRGRSPPRSSPPRSSRPPNRNRREDKVTTSVQEDEEFLRLRRQKSYR